jgi:hypothetical protein
MPARIETHAAFAVGKDLDPLGIESIETGIGEYVPMGRKKIMQPVVLALAGEDTRGIRRRLKALEKVAKRCLQGLGKDMTVLAQKLALGLIETGKAQSVTQAARL